MTFIVALYRVKILLFLQENKKQKQQQLAAVVARIIY